MLLHTAWAGEGNYGWLALVSSILSVMCSAVTGFAIIISHDTLLANIGWMANRPTVVVIATGRKKSRLNRGVKAPIATGLPLRQFSSLTLSLCPRAHITWPDDRWTGQRGDGVLLLLSYSPTRVPGSAMRAGAA